MKNQIQLTKYNNPTPHEMQDAAAFSHGTSMGRRKSGGGGAHGPAGARGRGIKWVRGRFPAMQRGPMKSEGPLTGAPLSLKPPEFSICRKCPAAPLPTRGKEKDSYRTQIGGTGGPLWGLVDAKKERSPCSSHCGLQDTTDPSFPICNTRGSFEMPPSAGEIFLHFAR